MYSAQRHAGVDSHDTDSNAVTATYSDTNRAMTPVDTDSPSDNNFKIKNAMRLTVTESNNDSDIHSTTGMLTRLSNSLQ